MFKLPHIIFMIITIALTHNCCIYFKEQTKSRQDTLIKYAAIISVFFDPIYWIWEINKFGSLNLSTTLPLYICSLFWLLMPIVAFAKNPKIKHIAMANICTIGLIGGVFGMVFNVYLIKYPFLSFVPMRSLLYHLLMIIVSTSLWYSKYYKPMEYDKFLCLIPLIILLVPCYFGNKLFGWDYCYMSGGKGTPLELISGNMPKLLFLMLLYGTLAYFINFVFYSNKFEKILSLKSRRFK